MSHMCLVTGMLQMYSSKFAHWDTQICLFRGASETFRGSYTVQ